MSPTRSGYRDLGLELVSLEENHSRTPKQPPTTEENRDDGVEDPFKLLLEEALVRERNDTMDNFSHILRQLPTTTEAPSTSSHFGGVTPFKVQVKFDIPLFEGHIDVDALEKWLSLLEGYFYVQNFSNSEKITFTLLKALPHVTDWWENYSEQHVEEESAIFGLGPTWVAFVDTLKEQYYPVGNYDDQYTRWTTRRQERGQTVAKFTNIFHTLLTKLGIK
jgi:hypothetical protein